MPRETKKEGREQIAERDDLGEYLDREFGF